MKYFSLKSFLERQTQPRLRLSLKDIVRVAGVDLPASAYEHAAWWANTKSHVQAEAWMGAGYKTENVDLAAQYVEFVRTEPSIRGVGEMTSAFDHGRRESAKKHPAAGAMKGTFTIRDWDVTKPALDENELAEWEANIERKMIEAERARHGKQ